MCLSTQQCQLCVPMLCSAGDRAVYRQLLLLKVDHAVVVAAGRRNFLWFTPSTYVKPTFHSLVLLPTMHQVLCVACRFHQHKYMHVENPKLDLLFCLLAVVSRDVDPRKY